MVIFVIGEGIANITPPPSPQPSSPCAPPQFRITQWTDEKTANGPQGQGGMNISRQLEMPTIYLCLHN